jgi:hypothetical protein
MIIPSQHASRVARAAAAPAGGVTPNAVNWANVGGGNPQQTAMLQITGITSPITLRLAYTDNANTYNESYSVQSTAVFGIGTYIAPDGTFTISNNQYLGFSTTTESGMGFQAVFFTLTNVSDNNAVIDTFQITAYQASSED